MITLRGYYLGAKHLLLSKYTRKNIKVPEGINVLDHFNVRHFDRWTKNIANYVDESKVLLRDGELFLMYDPDKPVYFDRSTWTWSWTRKKSTDEKYTCSSGRIDTEGIITVDIYNPGKIFAEHNVMQNGVVGCPFWIYFEEHPHDRHHPSRDVYFEIDGFESEPARPENFVGGVFSNYLGTQASNAKIGSVYIRRRLNKIHYTEVSWDGKGNFVWKFDGMVVRKSHMDLPKDLKPYIISSIGGTQMISSYLHVYKLIYAPMV